ncbi:MAG: nucleotidyltransferase domain-containing protein [Candidatus Hydrothermarchaeales archaeon]
MDETGLRKEAIDKFVERAQEYGGRIEKIILFGSYVRGDFTKESDVDVLVIWKGKQLDGWNSLERIVTDILIEFDVLISLKIISPKDYRTMVELGMPFIQSIEREGVVLG